MCKWRWHCNDKEDDDEDYEDDDEDYDDDEEEGFDEEVQDGHYRSKG